MNKIQKGFSFFCLIGLILLLQGKGIAAVGQEKPEEKTFNPANVKPVARWIADNAFPLKSVEAGHGFEDLQPLKEILRDVRIIGLGEATHGSREFFQFKHRMLEFLVEEMGYTVFGIEASYPACYKINDYVLYGKGDRDKALAGQGFWTWNTEEVAAMIDWMREYNTDAPEEKKVQFLGYDIQNIDLGMELIINYLKKIAPGYVEKAEAAMMPFIDRYSQMKWQQKPEEEKAEIRAHLLAMIGFLSFNQTRFSRLSSPAEFDFVLQHARVLLQLYNSYSIPWKEMQADENRYKNRDYYMAENIEYLFNRWKPGAKMVVWAHNGHIFRGSPFAMGTYLDQVFGDAYYALGFVFSEGGFQAINGDRESSRKGLVDFTLKPAPEGYLSWYFKKAGIGDCVIDFRSVSGDGVVGEWLKAAIPMRSLGSMYSEKWELKNFSRPTVLADYYDGMVFIDTTTRARPQPIGPGSRNRTHKSEN